MFNLPSPIEQLNLREVEDLNLRVDIKRDDLIHPVISGNKWRKLKLYIESFKQKKNSVLVSFGGAFSNHISALARIGQLYHIPTIGIIRGEELNKDSNETLRKASEAGMKLIFVSRSEYLLRNEKDYLQGLHDEFENALIIPEGGAGFLGVMGCTEIVSELGNVDYDYIACAVGTGTTAAGIAFAMSEKTKLLTFPATKNYVEQIDKMNELFAYAGLGESEIKEINSRVIWNQDHDFGGFGKFNHQLIKFINTFFAETKIPVDQVYNGKMIWGILKLVEEGFFKKDEHILIVHTGGVQGLNGIKEGLSPEITQLLK